MQTVSTKDTVKKKENDEMGESVGIQNTTTTTTERVEALIQIENVDESVTTKGVEEAVQREDVMEIETTTTTTKAVDEGMDSMTNQRVETNESTTTTTESVMASVQIENVDESVTTNVVAEQQQITTTTNAAVQSPVPVQGATDQNVIWVPANCEAVIVNLNGFHFVYRMDDNVNIWAMMLMPSVWNWFVINDLEFRYSLQTEFAVTGLGTRTMYWRALNRYVFSLSLSL